MGTPAQKNNEGLCLHLHPWLLPLPPLSSWPDTVSDTELLPDTALLTVLLVMDLPMELSDMVLAMLLPMPHPWSMLPLLSTLPLLPTTLSAMLPPTLLRSPPTPTTMEWLTSTLALPSASPRATMAPVLLRDPTLSTFLTAVSRL